MTKEQMEDRIIELEWLLGIDDDTIARFKTRLGLPPLVCRVVSVISKRGFITAGKLHAAVYGDRPEDKQPDMNLIRQYIYHARRKLNPLGINIESASSSVGYSMSEGSRTKLENYLAAA